MAENQLIINFLNCKTQINDCTNSLKIYAQIREGCTSSIFDSLDLMQQFPL
jgi:hypothetical protein